MKNNKLGIAFSKTVTLPIVGRGQPKCNKKRVFNQIQQLDLIILQIIDVI